MDGMYGWLDGYSLLKVVISSIIRDPTPKHFVEDIGMSDGSYKQKTIFKRFTLFQKYAYDIINFNIIVLIIIDSAR